MSSDDKEPISLEACTLPGSVRVTFRALELAEKFRASVPDTCIVAFSWFEGRRRKASKDAPWKNLGPGLDLGAYWSNEIPEQAIWYAGTMR